MNANDHQNPGTCPSERISRLFIRTCVLLLSLAGSGHAWAIPSSFSQSVINDITTSTPPESIGTTSSSVAVGGNSASSFLVPDAGKMGGAVQSDGSVVGVRTSTDHVDDWTCGSGASCLVAGPLSATIDFDASFSTGIGEFDLLAQYFLGTSVFRIEVSQDSGPVTAAAAWGVDPVDVLLTTDPLTNIVHVSTHFVGMTRPTSCDGSAGPCGLFSDEQMISLEMEGHGFVDASHTFLVNLASSNPQLYLTSTDGRSVGNPVSQVPEPGTLSLLGTCMVVLGAWRRRARRHVQA